MVIWLDVFETRCFFSRFELMMTIDGGICSHEKKSLRWVMAYIIEYHTDDYLVDKIPI